jgi:hypothetical protein
MDKHRSCHQRWGKPTGVELKTASRVRSQRRRAQSLLCLSLAVVVQAGAGTPLPASQHAPLPPGIEGADDVLNLLCRLGPDLPQELPMICLVTELDETAEVETARFDELLHLVPVGTDAVPQFGTCFAGT